ncbi:hypothetical protein [Embleya sp. MST-111070]|uniref:hypothetical protein n=1 Tax=Embleya sp. MST-111070 TaxID=3398231 RepID=UPI003F740B4D
MISVHTAHALPEHRVSQCLLRAIFDRVGVKPGALWRDRVLDEARHTADPVHLMRLFGIRAGTAVKYVRAAHPDKALPHVR